MLVVVAQYEMSISMTSMCQKESHNSSLENGRETTERNTHRQIMYEKRGCRIPERNRSQGKQQEKDIVKDLRQ